MKNNLTTEAGQSSTGENTGSGAHIDAINQVFALFQLNYHNQYFKAFSSEKELAHIKRLWLSSLTHFSPEILLAASRKVVEQSEFLPTLNRMIKTCERLTQPEIPDVRPAFMEACQAPSPKAAFKWSHPLVYHAGKACDWYFLQNNPEHITFPAYKKQYESLIERLNNGEKFLPPSAPALPEEIAAPLNKNENKKRMDDLKKNLKL